MKCNVCGNDYPNQAHFAVPGICESCFKKMPIEQQNEIIAQAYNYNNFAEMTISEKRIGFGRRLGAMALDLLFCVVIYLIIFFASGIFESQQLMAERFESEGFNIQLMTQAGYELMEQHMPALIFIQFMFLLYFSLEFIVGSSLGKLILGIQIGTQDAKPASTSQLLIRYLLKYSGIILAIFTTIYYQSVALSIVYYLVYITLIVGCFFTLSKDKLSFHDMAAKTAVYRKNEIIENNQNNTAIN